MSDFKKGDLVVAEKPLAVGKPPSSDFVMEFDRGMTMNEHSRVALVEKLSQLVHEDGLTDLEIYKVKLLFNGKNGKKLKGMVPPMDVFRFDDFFSKNMQSKFFFASVNVLPTVRCMQRKQPKG